MHRPIVDVIVLTRDDRGLDARVEHGLRSQQGIETCGYRVIGARRNEDRARWDTIARSRNHAVQVGDSPWLMFVDDDVVLEPNTIAELHRELLQRPRHAALGVNYLEEPRHVRPAPHVAMGATLFRREVLRSLRFRWEAGKCECRCCCEDLRRLGWEVDYLDSVRAQHLRPNPNHDAAEVPPAPGKILVAFNRRHFGRFRNRFLKSLRAAGNQETVCAVVYGLYPSELNVLRRLPNVQVIPLPVNGIMPPVRRLIDFQAVIANWPEETPVAYWDAGDVVFQDRLSKLWSLVQRHPDQLLAVQEPRGYPQNPAISAWTLSIHDPQARRLAFHLFARNPFLNSGFAAGTVRSMRRYLQQAAGLRSSAALAGSTDWGDQAALNLYCHREPAAWREIPQGWNFCLHDRVPGEVFVQPDGRLYSRRGEPIHVAHGNAGSLRKLELIPS